MHPVTGEWRYFKPEEIREALMWAGRGGVSVFEPEAPPHHLPSARLLAQDIPALYAASCELGIGPEFVQAKPHVPELTHFILSGEFLDKAKRKCPARLVPVALQQLQRAPSKTKPSMKADQHPAKRRSRLRPIGVA
jgi:hypothetical protein